MALGPRSIAITCTIAALYTRAPAFGQAGPVRVETTFLARDLNGNGRADYVVSETRRTPYHEEMYEHRIAVYLDAVPGAARPRWATSWDEQLGGPSRLIEALPLPGGGAAVAVSRAHADADEVWLLVVRGQSVREELHQQIDYGEGSFEVRKDGASVVADASVPVRLRGKLISPRVTCPVTHWAAVRVAFNKATRAFAVQRSICVRHPGN